MMALPTPSPRNPTKKIVPSNPTFQESEAQNVSNQSRVGRLEKMGLLCTVLSLMRTLKAPYRCIVKCGYSSIKASLLFIPIGMLLIYFFAGDIGKSDEMRSGAALLGIVMLSMGSVFFFMGMAICVFYVRLYKLYEEQLHEVTVNLSVQNYLASPAPSPAQSQATSRSSTPHRTDYHAGQIWAIQPTMSYTPPHPTAPPPPPSETNATVGKPAAR